MKLFTLLYIISLWAAAEISFAQVEASWSPSPQQALGVVTEDRGVQERRFVVRNKGSYSWQIVRGYTSCGCTQVELQQNQVVRPGDSAQVIVRFDPAGKAGPFREIVTVQLTDGEAVTNETLTFTGEVRRSAESLKRQFPVGEGDIRLSAGKIDFGEINRSNMAERHIVVCNTGASRQRIRWSTSSRLVRSGEDQSIELDTGETYDIELKWDGKREQRWGIAHETLTIIDARNKIQSVDLSAVLLPDVSALTPQERAAAPVLQMEKRVNIGTLPPGQKSIQRIAVQNIGKSDLHILRAYSDHASVEVKSTFPLVIKPGGSTSIEVQIIPDGAPDFPITLISDDAKKPRQTVRLYKK